MEYRGKCALETCRAISHTHSKRRFFLFPQNDENLLEIWRQKCGFSKRKLLKSLKLCEIHFDRRNIQKRKLVMNTVPEYYLTSPKPVGAKEDNFIIKMEKHDAMDVPKSNIKIVNVTSSAGNAFAGSFPYVQPEDSSSDTDSEDIDIGEEIHEEQENMKDVFLPARLQTYDCEVCSVKKNTYKQLIIHLSFHWDAYLYECERCGKEFQQKHLYREHAFAHQARYACRTCGEIFRTPKHLRRHEWSHATETPVSCPHCEKMFSRKQALHIHYLRDHEDKCATCTQCNRKFKLSVQLKRHMIKVHGAKSEPKHTKEIRKTRRTPNIACGKCGKLVTSEVGLRLHIRNIHYRDRPFPCSYCSKTFIFTKLLERHMQYHINDKNSPVDPKTKEKLLKYKCDQCDKSFTVLRCLNQHKVLHSGLKQYKCEECGKSFSYRSYLEKHIRSMHNTAHPRNVICGFCGKVSLHPSSHRSHMLSHTGEKPFACTICSAAFKHAKSLRRHMDTKHSSEDL